MTFAPHMYDVSWLTYRKQENHKIDVCAITLSVCSFADEYYCLFMIFTVVYVLINRQTHFNAV